MKKAVFKTSLAVASILGATIAGTTLASAQLGNGTPPIDNGPDKGELSVAADPDGFTPFAVNTGPGLSRLPLTTEEAVPIGESREAVPDLGKSGSSKDSLYEKEAVGTHATQWPYATARVAITGIPGPGTGTLAVPVTSKPFRLTGKLWMRFGSSWFVCTASLIKRGVLITAAHCVHNYGQQGNGWADEVRWYPANFGPSGPGNAGGPWGYYNGRQWRILFPYWNGTDTCQAGSIGVVCNNDIATVVLYAKGGKLPGETLGGWYGYGWNGYSFPTSPAFGNNRVAAITQLGYPSAFDLGRQMQRNDSFGKLIVAQGANGKTLLNTQLGSSLTGGSSGGPWLVNFGTRTNITDTSSATRGSANSSNIVVGVTSWGYTNINSNVQGASWFGQNAEYPNANYGGRGAGNIGALMMGTCNAFPAHC
ncbi:MAG: hypothetical protein R3D45_05180 [Rhizobiaceae bacterium]